MRRLEEHVESWSQGCGEGSFKAVTAAVDAVQGLLVLVVLVPISRAYTIVGPLRMQIALQVSLSIICPRPEGPMITKNSFFHSSKSARFFERTLH